ncbi:zinc finger CCHC domain-containing protein 13-like [Drosophila persimilis]|uniref:zinc finger CCHC domain-containing protein 13-like n=1 Tax=Drosophila persimilis TaxID=7234 RepID=UPI000F0763F0|nr:zinc finger CCHC domain-containing protein 13-like [Drosophila persimilis]
MLPKKYGSTEGANTGASPTPIRCYNCNSLGHVAGECRKPKRERGACYGCGSMSHQVSHCDEKKYKIASSTQVAQ